MFLINAKLAGNDVPSVLPPSLIPPSLRNTTGPQEVLTGPSSATRDLFDLFDDAPAPPVTAIASSGAFLPNAVRNAPQQPDTKSSPPAVGRGLTQSPLPNDLLGDDSPNVPETSAELGNKQNELLNTNRAIETLSSTRQSLEQQATSSSEQLQELEAKISAARAKHDTENKAVEELRQRVQEQSTRAKALEAEVITAESDVSALKSEKTELEQALLKNKEEVRDLQRRMKAVDEERSALKNVLEKLRKESRQQKGMVTIAKKQLSTAETARDAVQRDIDSEAAAAAEVPLPPTPQTLSPVPTGVSQRSNNPFDRLSRAGSHPQGPPPGTGAGVVTLAGIAPPVTEPAHIEEHQPASPAVGPPLDLHQPQEVSGIAFSPDEVKEGQVDKLDGLTGDFERSEPAADPFGLPSHSEGHAIQPQVADSHAVIPATTSSAPTDFDSAFADFDETTKPQAVQARDESAHVPENPADTDAPSPVLAAPIPDGSVAQSTGKGPEVPGTDALIGGIPTQSAIEPHQQTTIEPRESPERLEPLEPLDAVSSDEDEGPEDLDAPVQYQSKTPVSSPPPEPTQARRSAPPPPVRNAVEELDPFGAPSASLTQTPTAERPSEAPLPTVAGTTGITSDAANFDDDDFDFSDLPPAKVEESSSAAPAKDFDDEFAGFDDEFGTAHIQSGSDNSTSMSKSFEMVSPAPRPFDEWGATPSQKPPQTSMSFDDAFEGDFE